MLSIIGPIVHLQIQRGALKVGEKGARRYTTDLIAPLEQVRMTPDGVVGLDGDQETFDAHHRAHPLRKNDDGVHGVSVGFTSHYHAMRERFGHHLRVGCAGENLIVDTAERVDLERVRAGLVVLDAAGREKGRLVNVEVARPCKPFTGFAHRNEPVPPDVFKDSLRFLDGGMRGYYCTWAGAPAVVCLGDRLALA